jgi:hypothetical protein
LALDLLVQGIGVLMLRSGYKELLAGFGLASA